MHPKTTTWRIAHHGHMTCSTTITPHFSLYAGGTSSLALLSSSTLSSSILLSLILISKNPSSSSKFANSFRIACFGRRCPKNFFSAHARSQTWNECVYWKVSSLLRFSALTLALRDAILLVMAASSGVGGAILNRCGVVVCFATGRIARSCALGWFDRFVILWWELVWYFMFGLFFIWYWCWCIMCWWSGDVEM